MSKAVPLAAGDTLKVTLTSTESKTAKKAHQVFLTLKETSSGLEESFPFSVRETGKGKLELVSRSVDTIDT